MSSDKVVNERSIEIPWCLDRLKKGLTIDIGSSDAAYLDKLGFGTYLLDQRPLTTTQPMFTSFTRADVRMIPLFDNMFDNVLCISTYEHFGMEHEPYGTIANPDIAQAGLREMWRILKPGGSLLITVPFGSHKAYGWLRQWDYDALKHEFNFVWPYKVEEEFYLYNLAENSYKRTFAEDCSNVEYDLNVKRANSIVCLRFEKGGV